MGARLKEILLNFFYLPEPEAPLEKLACEFTQLLWRQVVQSN